MLLEEGAVGRLLTALGWLPRSACWKTWAPPAGSGGRDGERSWRALPSPCPSSVGGVRVLSNLSVPAAGSGADDARSLRPKGLALLMALKAGGLKRVPRLTELFSEIFHLLI